MLLPAHDVTAWVAERGLALATAWTPQIGAALEWEAPFAEALADELHAAMLTTMQRGGAEREYLGIVARARTGIEPSAERSLAERYFGVTLKLARAASRHAAEARTWRTFPTKRATVVADGRTKPDHLALAGIVLPTDHPFWLRRHPPLDMECRCGAIPMTRGQFERSGLTITSDAELAEREAMLRSDWPAEFAPLLDFRKPIALDAG